MSCLLRYYCLFRQKLLYPLAFCPNDGSIFGCCCLNLPLHRAPVIESLRLELFSPRFKPENVTMWVMVAVSHCVRELKISVLRDLVHDKAKKTILPSNLCTCKSLVFLELDGGILLDVPRMVSLPCLKKMKLENVIYLNDETLQRILSNCPTLEDLVVGLSDYGTMGILTVVVPSLQRLSLYIPFWYDINGFVIETPSLKYLKLDDDNRKSHQCLIQNMPYLIEAHLEVGCPDIKSIIRSVTSVKRLAICSELEHLEPCICKKHSSSQLVRLLNASPKLQRLDFNLMDGHEPETMIYWNQPSTVPECMLSSLQTFTWILYTGSPEERAVAVYILKNGVHLKSATIWFSEFEVPESVMVKELARSSRASAKCQLRFGRAFDH